MTIGVVIPTVDRPDALRRVLAAVQQQTRPAHTVVVAPPQADMLPTLDDFDIVVADGARGASAQRNAAVLALSPQVEYIAFFDDDSLPRDDYLERAVAVLETRPEVVAVTGRVVLDGVPARRQLAAEEMTAALEASRGTEDGTTAQVDRLYGANMVVRADAARVTPFDERLPLYSWLEDLDFSRRLMARGQLLKLTDAVATHQGSASGGRTQHRRVGYSQVSNFLYLRRKGSVRSLEVTALVGRPALKSLAGSLVGQERPERRERLRGMGLALLDAVRGRVTPERILDL